MKKILMVVGGLIAAVLLILVVVVVRIDPEELGQKVIARINEGSDLQLEADVFSIKVFKGITMENVSVHRETAAESLDATIASVVFEHEVWPLLRGEIVIHRVILDQPRIETTSRPEATGAAAQEADSSRSAADEPQTEELQADSSDETADRKGDGSFAIRVDEIRIDNGRLTQIVEGAPQETITVEGLDLSLTQIRFDPQSGRLITGLSANGDLDIEAIVLGETTIREARGALTLQNGDAVFTDVGFSTDNGDLTLDALTADLAATPPPFALEVHGGLDLNGIFGVPSDGGFGPVSMTFSAEGEGADADAMTGTGALTLDGGQIPSFKMMQLVEAILGRQLITGTAYQPTEARFEIAEGNVALLPFDLATERARLRSEGTIDLDGPLSIRLGVGIRRDDAEIDGISAAALDSMTDDEGWTTIPFAVRGTLEEPDVGLDWDPIKGAAVDTARDAVGRGIKKGVRGLLGDKDDD